MDTAYTRVSVKNIRASAPLPDSSIRDRRIYEGPRVTHFRDEKAKDGGDERWVWTVGGRLGHPTQERRCGRTGDSVRRIFPRESGAFEAFESYVT